MPSDIPDRPNKMSPPLMDDERISEIRERVRAVLDTEPLKVPDIAREAEVAYGTLSSWVNGTYPGRNDRVAADMERWLGTRGVRKQLAAAAPVAPLFVMTQTAEAVYGLLQHAQHMPDIATFVGAPGIGKTSAACNYARNTSSVWKITGNPALTSPRAVLHDLCRVMQVNDGGMLSKLQRRIADKVRGTGGLIIVDEAQHLSSEAYDQIRSIHDEADIGIALLGNEQVYSRLEGDGRRERFAQLTSRVGMRMKRSSPRRADVDALLDGWKIEGAAERRMLHAIARKPGALRLMGKTLKLSHMLAAPEGVPVNVDCIRRAFGQVSTEMLAAGIEGAA